jgi:uncharacterized protein (DUF1800 family)
MARSTRKRTLLWLLPLAIVVTGAALLAQPGAPAIQVLRDTNPVAANSLVGFGNTPVGVAKSITFTVKNTGTADLLVSEAISVPQGFTLMTSFPGVPGTNLPTNVPAFAIKPGETAAFTVALNSALVGRFEGEVSFQTNVADRTQFVFRVRGTSLPPPAVNYVDDNDARFTFTSGWTQNYSAIGTSGKRPFQRALSSANSGTGAEVATWTFPGLEPGEYKVEATWVGYTWGATNAPYTIHDGTTPLRTVRVDQQVDSTGVSDGGSVWQDLGTYTVTGSTLVVKMSNDANGCMNADGVRITRLGYPGGVVDDAGSGFGTTGFWQTGFVPFRGNNFQKSISRTLPSGRRTANATATWSFNVDPGTYRVLVSYNGYRWAASNAPFTVFDGDTSLTPSPRRVNQRVTPGDMTEATVGWRHLGFYTVLSNTLRVQLGNNANGIVIADAVRVERINTPTVPSTADTVRFLQQASWGPTPTLIPDVQKTGLGPWLDNQFLVAPTSYPTMPLYNGNNNVTNNNTTSCYGDPNVAGNPARSACLRDHYSTYPLQNRFFTNALYGEDQTRQRVAWALHKIWVVSGVELDQPAWIAPYLQILSDEAFGNYRSLMYKITLNAAMGNYLDMNGSTRTRPNENYPRELLQLFTIGLDELNPDGSKKLVNGLPIATYDQAMIDQMTKVFTGWRFAPAPAPGIPNYIDPMRLRGAAAENAADHDFTQKTLLRGFVQPARTASVANAYLDLNEALDNIYNHPSVGPFIVKQLIQQLVTSNPSPAYVARVVDTFNRNKTNANQMREVVRAILLDPEARGDRKNATNYGHLREPVLYVSNLMRMFDAKSADRTTNSDGYLNPDVTNLDQNVFRPPSVFSYFSPFKVVVGGSPPVIGPEYQLLTTSTVLRRINFINQAFAPASGRAIDVVRGRGTTPSGVDPVTGNPLIPTGPLGTAVDISFLQPLATDPAALVERLNTLMMHGSMTAELKADLVTAISAVSATNTRKRARTAVYLVATSSQYQVQK